MDAFQWFLTAVAAAAVGGLIFLTAKGYITKDGTVLAIGKIIDLCREAERIWRGYQGAGADKKQWVLSQLGEDNLTAAGMIIDAVVAWMNTVGGWGE